MLQFNNREDILALTPLWTGERFEDGRPKVPSDILRRMRSITMEEAWGPLFSKGYKFQIEKRFKRVHDDRKLVGRAVTSVMIPMRPDLFETLMSYGKANGRQGYFNQWVIDNMVEDDVAVVDLFDKVENGTYVGGNLSTAVASRTKRGGLVVWGGVRDLEQIAKVDNEYFQIYYRGDDPSAINYDNVHTETVMTSINAPCRVGNAVCMPGDVVLGTLSGVIFIPPHLAEQVVVRAEKNHIRDVFGFERLADGTYNTAQIDFRWSVRIMKDFINWFATAPAAEPFSYLTWEAELEQAREDEIKFEAEMRNNNAL